MRSTERQKHIYIYTHYEDRAIEMKERERGEKVTRETERAKKNRLAISILGYQIAIRCSNCDICMVDGRWVLCIHHHCRRRENIFDNVSFM